MKTHSFRRIAFTFVFLVTIPALSFAQGAKEFVDKTGKDKISKAVQIFQTPVTAGGFSDGHGRNPVLTDRSQIPDTVAIISFYINDFGTVRKGPYSISSYWISPDGGNMVANEIERKTMQTLKESFARQGIVLLTPLEYLNTKEKQNYYYKTFVPKVSKLAKFVSNIETKHVDTSVGADYYRPFDISVCWDAVRAESLVADLGKNIGVKGILTVAINLQTDSRNINALSVQMAFNGPNPIPKEDKRYVAQNMGNGYYDGQIYSECSFAFPKPVLIGKYENTKTVSKKTRTGINTSETEFTKSGDLVLEVEGLETIMASLVEKSFESMHGAIDKAASKYKRK